MEGKEISWRQLSEAIRPCKRFGLICAGLLLLELVLSQVLPAVIPEKWYLGQYLPWQALSQTRRFLNNDLDVEPDPDLGWHNRPEATYRGIRYDRFGSRSARGIRPGGRKKWRVVFLGDSRVNGYTFVNNDQTINACLEDDDVETLNLATPFCGLDQMYLAMQKAIGRFQPDAVVIGVGPQTGMLLDCHYIPFLVRREYGMPFLKPRYALEGNRLVLQNPSARALLETLPDSPELLGYLREHDVHYRRFRYFRTWEATPFLSALSLTVREMDGISDGLFSHAFGQAPEDAISNPELVKALVRAIEQLAEQHHIRVSFLVFPTLNEFQGNKHQAYNQLIALLRSESARYISILSLLRQYRGTEELFGDDLHITYTANRLIAEALRRFMLTDEREGPVIAR